MCQNSGRTNIVRLWSPPSHFAEKKPNGKKKKLRGSSLAKNVSTELFSHRLQQQCLIQQLGDDIDGEADSDQSGWSVSLSNDGRTVAIGSRYNDGNGNNSGHVRVYSHNDGTGWTLFGGDIDGEAAGDCPVGLCRFQLME